MLDYTSKRLLDKLLNKVWPADLGIKSCVSLRKPMSGFLDIGEWQFLNALHAHKKLLDKLLNNSLNATPPKNVRLSGFNFPDGAHATTMWGLKSINSTPIYTTGINNKLATSNER